MLLYGFVATFLAHVWKIVSQHLFCKSIVLPQLKILTSIGKYLCVSLTRLVIYKKLLEENGTNASH